MRRLLLASLILLALPALAPARTIPADELTHIAIEVSVYDPATKCDDKIRRGVVRLQRCAENRAIDSHLDASSGAGRRAAGRLVGLLLATDSVGNPQALALPMGVEELIWDCWYRAAGTTEFQPYRTYYGKHEKLRKHVNVSVAHCDHVHVGMAKAGAAGRTSFWRGHTG